MKRRTFIAAFGSTVTGGAAVFGSGAVTSVSANRSVSVEVAADATAFLALEPGDSDLVTQENGTLAVHLDGAGTLGTGVNMDAVTTIGDPANPADEYAFKIRNLGTDSLMVKLNYYFENPGWIEPNTDQSFLRFEIHDSGDYTQSSSQTYPEQGSSLDHSLGHPTGAAFGSNPDDERLEVGEEYYMTLTVDTTGSNAAADDDLTGTAEIHATTTATSEDEWNP
jgi:hypothetical protein